jgi:AraC family transcriptional regulator
VQTQTAIYKSDRRKRKKDKSLSQPPFSEAPIWQSISREWRQLYGGFKDRGVSIEWHDFESKEELAWSRSFHPDSLELCLNLSGHGSVLSSDGRLDFEPFTAGFYAAGQSALKASRRSGERHQFVTLEFSAAFLKAHLADGDGALHPLVEKVVHSGQGLSGVSAVHRLTTANRQLVTQFLKPPVFQAGQRLWFQAKVFELMSEFFFERSGEDELFCDRQKRIVRQRVDRTVAILRENLTEPPSLEELGQQVACSPFHLSRIFSKEMGMSIPQFIRQIRMERAAEFLASGKYNVTEAAMEVGYSSLSHFSQAFCQTIGCCPNLYPHAKALQKPVI